MKIEKKNIDLDGIVLLNKASQATSFDYIRQLKKNFSLTK
jgi:tRNA U55 pseudouridine synthase TruB